MIESHFSAIFLFFRVMAAILIPWRAALLSLLPRVQAERPAQAGWSAPSTDPSHTSRATKAALAERP